MSIQRIVHSNCNPGVNLSRLVAGISHWHFQGVVYFKRILYELGIQERGYKQVSNACDNRDVTNRGTFMINAMRILQ